jgi:hypothetical protein
MMTQQVLPSGPGPGTGDEPLPAIRTTKRRSRTGLGFLAAVVVIGIISLLGGWDIIMAERDETLVSVSPGEMAHADPFDVTFLRAFHATDMEPMIRPKSGKRLLLISLDVVNTDKIMVSSTLLARALEPNLPLATMNNEPDGQAEPADFYRIQDHQEQRSFQPGLPQRILAAWWQDEASPLPTEVTVTLSGHTHQGSSVTEGLMFWSDREEKVSVTLPVEELKKG